MLPILNNLRKNVDTESYVLYFRLDESEIIESEEENPELY
ncbi:MAG: hypothetical protein QG641_2698 [Candidatus Poribacteria bacterium]|nr:hypothetical protein [Candidatus Poribacteria bacterium]